MDTLRYAAVMVIAGMGIPTLAALNAALGARIGSPVAAAAVLFSVALAVTICALFATVGFSGLRFIGSQPPHLFLAGLLIAFYVLSITAIAPYFGIGNAIVCVLLGQLASSAVIDHFGLFGALHRPVSLTRLFALGLVAVGVALAQRA